MLVVRVSGICSFIADRGHDAFWKRVVLPVDDMGMSDSHIPHVEIEEADLDHYTVNGAAPKAYSRGLVSYLRWELTGYMITVGPIDAAASSPPVASPRFNRHVPALREVCPPIQPYARQECYQIDPPSSLVAGYFDISNGTLDVADLEKVTTVFQPQRFWGPERTGEAAELRLTMLEDTPTHITLTPFRGSDGKWTDIVLKPGADTITIGNLLRADIETPTGSGKGRSEHFLIYYNLADPKPNKSDQATPDVSLVPVNACSVTTYP
jgi:hypothetical protein